MNCCSGLVAPQRGFPVRTLSGGRWPSGNSKRKVQTSFSLLEAISTYTCSLIFAGPAGGLGGKRMEAKSLFIAILGVGVQGPAAARLPGADTVP